MAMGGVRDVWPWAAFPCKNLGCIALATLHWMGGSQGWAVHGIGWRTSTATLAGTPLPKSGSVARVVYMALPWMGGLQGRVVHGKGWHAKTVAWGGIVAPILVMAETLSPRLCLEWAVYSDRWSMAMGGFAGRSGLHTCLVIAAMDGWFMGMGGA